VKTAIISSEMSESGTSNKTVIAFTTAMLVALMLLYAPWLVDAKSFYYQDAGLYFEPMCRFIGNALAHGKIPTWNPFLHCGMSQIALASPGIFYPPNLIFATSLSFSQALASLMVFHQLVAGLGGFLLVRSLGWGSWSASFAGIILALTGYNFSLTHNYTLVSAVSWIPWIIFCVKNLIDAYAFRWLLLGSLCVFLEITTGRPDIIFPAVLLWLVASSWFAFHSYQLKSDMREAAGYVARMLSPLLLGTLLAAPVVVPVLEWLPLSRRLIGLPADEVLRYSASWYDLLSIVIFQPFGNLTVLWSPIKDVFFPGLPYVAASYVGAVAVTFALIALFDRTFSWRLPIGILSVAFLIFAVGRNTPIFPLALNAIPALSVIRFPIKLLWFVVLAIVILSARGFFRAFDPSFSIDFRKVLIAWGALFLPSLFVMSEPGLMRSLAYPMLPPEQLLKTVKAAELSLGLCGVFASMTGLITLGAIKLHRRTSAATVGASGVSPRLIPAAFLSFVTLNLLYCGLALQQAGHNDFYRSGSILEKRLTKEAGGPENTNSWRLLVMSEVMSCPPWLLGKDPASATERAYQYTRQLLFPNTNMDFSVAATTGFEGTGTAAPFIVLANALSSSSLRTGERNLALLRKYLRPGMHQTDLPLARFCRVTATKYATTEVVSMTRLKEPDVAVLDSKYFEQIGDEQQLNLRIYKVKDALPRAYISTRWKWILHDQALNEFFSEKSSLDDGVVLLEEGQEGKFAPLPTESPTALAMGETVQIVRDDGDLLQLKVTTADTAVLVLSDTFYPGWKASVDGASAEILRANAFMRALRIPDGGEHVIEFRYEPESLKVGLLLHVFAVVALLLVYLVGRFRSASGRA
jgi:hypothetical protein